MSRPPALFNCLIRTHHITSRKKVQRVRRAAAQLNVDWVLIHYGRPPGIMFAEAHNEAALEEWVAAVQALRYKDFRCVARPAAAPEQALSAQHQQQGRRPGGKTTTMMMATGFDETESVAEFAREMEVRGLGAWWKRAMGYQSDS